MNYDLLSYLLKASLVLAILTLAYAWLVKRETFVQVNRWLLWMNVAATVLLPIVPVPDFEWMPDTPAKVVAEVIPAVPPKAELTPVPEKATAVPAPVTVADEAVQTTASWSVWDWIGRVYALVMAVLTIKLLIQLFSLWRLKSGGTTYATDEGIRLVESDKITSPFSFFHWIFYNPTQHSDDEWQQVWAHECVHAQQRHSLDMLTAEVLKIVFWFNPFAWWHQRLVQETLEFVTDRAVLDSGVEKKSYQYHLLRSTLSADNESFTNHFNKSLLKNRIAMMNKAKSSWKALGKYGVFIGMLWVCAAFMKPYRAEVAAKVINNIPQLRELIFTQSEENKLKSKTGGVYLDEKNDDYELPINTDSISTPMSDLKLTTNKYVSYNQKNEIHILITPKTTLSDIVEIQQELKKIGKDLKVVQWLTDSSARYLRKLVLEFTPLAGKIPQIISRGTDTTFMPMKPLQLSMPISNFGYKSSYGDCCVDFSQQALSREEDDIAKFEALMIEAKPDVVARLKRNGDYFKPVSIFYPHSLFYEGSMMAYQALSTAKKAENTTLYVKEPYRNAQFRLNGRKSSLEEIENLSPQQFLKAEKYDVTDSFGNIRDTYFVIYSK